MRLSFGRSTPEIRAIGLSLPLLVFWIFANDHDAPVPANYLALVASWLDGGSNFHDFPWNGQTGEPDYLERVIRPRFRPWRAKIRKGHSLRPGVIPAEMTLREREDFCLTSRPNGDGMLEMTA